jgi:hypothetical protein
MIFHYFLTLLVYKQGCINYADLYKWYFRTTARTQTQNVKSNLRFWLQWIIRLGLWDMILCILVTGHSLQEPAACTLQQNNKIHPDDWGSRCLQNAGNHLPYHTVSHPRRLQSEQNEILEHETKKEMLTLRLNIILVQITTDPAIKLLLIWSWIRVKHLQGKLQTTSNSIWNMSQSVFTFLVGVVLKHSWWKL